MFSDLIFDYLVFKNEAGKDLFENIKVKDYSITKEKYEIKTEEESKLYNKPKGLYELIAIPDVLFMEKDVLDDVVDVLSDSFKAMFGKITNKDRVLVVGLGNRHISSDSLGAKVVGGINVTFESGYFPKIMAIAPSVMGLTGIETVDIIEGIANKVKPSHLIIIDSLCASGVERLGKSIQITNNGICPGAGIGNNRKCIDNKLAPNVYSIGVPLLIYASTFVESVFDKYQITEEKISSVMQDIKKLDNLGEVMELLKSINKIKSDPIDDMVVSIKDIEECVSILSGLISKALNIALGVDL